MTRSLLLLAFVTAGITAGPITSNFDKCAKKCVGTDKFNYETGKTYKYEYEAWTNTNVEGASEDHTGLHFTTDADIEVISPCEYVLSLTNVKLEDADPRDVTKFTANKNAAEFARALEQNALRFAFQDGRVERLCETPSESYWALNVKRGLLSAFQNSMHHFKQGHTVNEIDVSGNCNAEYKIINSGWRGGLSITKTKDLIGCTNRHNYISSLQATPYFEKSNIQSLPLMKGTHSCEQHLDSSRRLRKSVCEETYVLRPFSKQEKGARTVTKHSLVYKNEHNKVTTTLGPVKRHSSLLFEHETTRTAQWAQRARAEQTLARVCALTDVRPSTPQLFAELVQNMRSLDTAALQQLHRDVHAGRVCAGADAARQTALQYFHDAVPMVGSAASVSLVCDLITEGEVTGRTAEAWLASLAFVAQPGMEMLKELKPLLSHKKLGEKAMLPVSSLVYSICKNNEGCRGNIEVEEIVDLLAKNLLEECGVKNQAEIVAVIRKLKAMGNIGSLANSAAKLKQCLVKAEHAIEVRLAAIEAYRRTPCDQDRDHIMNVFESESEDSELRIAAYLAMMHCPSRDLFERVGSRLEREPINQVGSFVWTHLTNLKQTADPFRQDVRRILDNQRLSREFDMDKRKFSRNYEGSLFFKTLNSGVKAESNLVWSPKSFAPRSATVNLTVDLFGNSMNLFEMGGRVEGLELLVEKIFGKNGYFPDNTAVKKLNNDVDKMQKSFKPEIDSQLKGSMFLKTFGNELFYADLSELPKNFEFNFFNLMMTLAKEHKVELSKSFVFMDSTLTIPTVIGMPLKLTLNGTTSVDVKIGGKMDVRKAASSPKELNIDGYIKPSGAVQVSGAMSVDAFVTRTTLKMVSTLHSSTEINGLIKIDNGNVLSTKWNIPSDKMEIITMNTKFFVTHKESEREQKMVEAGRTEKKLCTGAKFGKATGLKLCGDISYPVIDDKEEIPALPFVGPFSMRVELTKEDKHKSYEIDAILKLDEPELAHFKMSFNTPSSVVDREFLLEGIYNLNKKVFSLEARSPWKKALLTGELVNEQTMKKALLKLALGKAQIYSVKTELAIDRSKDEVIYTPSVELLLPKTQPMVLKGILKHTPKSRLTIDMALRNVFTKPVRITGTISRQGANKKIRFQTNLAVKSPYYSGSLTGFAERSGALYRTRLSLGYGTDVTSQQTVTFNAKTKYTLNKRQTKVITNVAVSSTQFPETNFQADVDYLESSTTVQKKFELQYGANPKDYSRRIRYNENANFVIENGGRTAKIDYIGKLLWKAMGINMQAKINHRHSATELKHQSTLNYRPGKHVSIDALLSRAAGPLLSLNSDLKFNYPGRNTRFATTITEKQSGVYHEQTIIQWSKNAQIRTVAVYSQKHPAHDVRVEIYPLNEPSITVTTSIKLVPKDFKFGSTLDRAGRSYSADVSYLIRPREQFKGQVDLSHPQRHLVLKTETTASVNSVQTQNTFSWDADNDAAKKVSVDGKISMANQKTSGAFKIMVVKKKITATFNHEQKGRNFNTDFSSSWAAGKTIEFDSTYTIPTKVYGEVFKYKALLKTPFTKVIKINGDNHIHGKGIAGNLKFSAGKYSAQYKIDINKIRGWAQVVSEITLLTSISGFKSSNVKLSYDVQPSKLLTEFSSTVRGRTVTFEMNANKKFTANKRALEGSMSLKTPWTLAKNVLLEGRYNDNGKEYSALVKNAINAKKSSVEFNMVHENENGIFNSGKLTVTTPIKRLSKTVVSWNNKLQKNAFTLSDEIMINKKKINLEASATFTKGNNAMQTRGTFTINTPYKRFSKAIVTWNNKIQDNTAILNNKITINQHTVDLESQTSLVPSKNALEFTTKTTLSTPLQSLRQLESSAKVIYQNRRLTSELEITRNNLKELKFTKELKFQRELGVEMSIESRFFDEVSISCLVNHIRDPFTGQVKLTWGNEQYIEANTLLSYNGFDYIKSNVAFKSSIPSFEMLKAGAEHSKNGKERKTHLEIEYTSGKKVEIDHTLFYGDAIRQTLKLKTPCRYVNSLESQFENTLDNNGLNNLLKVTLINNFKGMNYEHQLKATGIENVNGEVSVIVPSKINTKLNLKHNKNGNTWLTVIEGKSNGKEIEFESKLNANNGLEYNMKVNTPFNALKSARVSLDHSGSIEQFENKFKLNADSHDASFAAYTNLDFESIRSMKFFGKVSKNDDSANVNVNYNMNDDKILAIAKIDMGSNINNELNLNIGLKKPVGQIKLTGSSFDDIKFVYEIKLGKVDLEVSSLLTYGGDKEVSLNAGGSIKKGLEAEMSFRSPFKAFKKFETSLKHKGDFNKFNTRFDLNHNLLNKKVIAIVQSEMSTKGADLIFKLNGLEMPVLFKLEHKLDGYFHQTTSVLAKYGKYSTNVNGEFKASSLGYWFVNCDIQLNPSQTVVNFATKMNALKLEKSTFKSELTINNEKLLNILLKTNKNMKLIFNFDTKYAQISIEHEGPLNNFKHQSSIKVLSKKFSLNGNSQITDNMFESDFSLKTPYNAVKTLRINTNNKLENWKFISLLNLERNNEMMMKLSSDINLSEGVALLVTLETPYKNLKKTSLSLTHQGTLKKFNCNAEFKYGAKNIKADIDANFENTIKFVTSFNSPFKYFESLSMSIQHSGKFSKFDTVASFAYTADKKMNLNINFDSNDKIDGRFTLETPCQHVKTIDATIKHTGDIKKFNTDITFTYGDQKSTILSIESDATQGYNGKAKLQTPFSCINELYGSINHEPKSNGFENTLFASYNDQSGKIFTTLSNAREFNFKINIQTPFKAYRVGQFTLTKNGNLHKTIRTEMALLFNEMSGKTEAEFTKDPLNAKFTVKTPFENFKSLEFNVNNKGVLPDFNTEISIVFNDKRGSLNAEFSKALLSGKLSIKTPFEKCNEFSANFKQNNVDQKYTSTLIVEIDDKRYQASATVFTSNTRMLIADIKTPHEILKSATFKIGYTAEPKTYTTNLFFSHNLIGKFEEKSTLTFEPTIKGSLILKTPFSQIDELVLNIEHSGDWEQFQCNLNMMHNRLNNYKLQSSFKKLPLKFSVEVHTPHTLIDDIVLSFEHTGKLHNFESKMNLDYVYQGNRKAFKLNLASATKNNVNIKLDFITPITEMFSTQITHQKNGASYTSGLLINYGTKSVKYQSTLITKPNIEFSYQLQTPFRKIKSASGSFNFVIGATSTSELIITVANKKFTAKMSASKASPKFSIDIRTPFELLTQLSVDLSQKTQQKKSSIQFEMTYNVIKKYTLNVEFENLNRKTLSIAATTPHENYENMDSLLTFQIKKKSVDGHLKVNFLSQTLIDTGLVAGPRSTRFTMHSAMLKSISFTSNYNLDLPNGEIDVQLKFDEEPLIVYDLSYEFTKNKISTRTTLKTPIKQLKSRTLVFNYRRQENTVEISLESLKGNKKQHTANFVATETRSNVLLTSNIELKVTIPGKNYELTITHDLTTDKTIKGAYVFTWAPKKTIKFTPVWKFDASPQHVKVDGTFTLTTPFTALKHAHVNMKHSQSANKYSTQWLVQHNRKNLLEHRSGFNAEDDITGHMEFTSPFKINTGIQINGVYNDFTAAWKLNYENSKPIEVNIKHSDLKKGNKVNVNTRIDVVTAYRSMAAGWKTAYAGKKTFTNTAMINFNLEKNQVFSQTVAFEDKSDYESHDYVIGYRLDTPIRSVDIQAKHNMNQNEADSSMTFKWDAASDSTKELMVRNTVKKTVSSTNVYSHQFTIDCPAFEPISLNSEIQTSEKNARFYKVKTQLKTSGNPEEYLTVAVSFNDLSRYRTSNYSAQIALTYPYRYVDLQWDGQYANSKNLLSASASVKFLNSEKLARTIALIGEIHKLKNQIHLQMNTPMEKLSVDGKLAVKKYTYDSSVVLSRNGEQRLSTALEINPTRGSFDLKAANQADKLHMFGKYLTPTAFSFQANKVSGGKSVTLSKVFVQLKNKHLLHTTVTWPPTMISTIAKETKAKLAEFEAHFTPLVAFSIKEFTEMISNVVNAHPITAPSMDYVQNEIASVLKDLETAKRALVNIYNNDEFYLKTIYSVVKPAVLYTTRMIDSYAAELKRKVTYNLHVLSVKVSENYDAFCSKLHLAKAKLSVIYYKIYFAYENAVSYIREKTIDLLIEGFLSLRPVFNEFYRISNKVSKAMTIISDYMSRKYGGAVNKFLESPSVVRVSESFKKFSSKLRSGTNVDFKFVHEQILSFTKNIARFGQTAVNRYRKFASLVSDRMSARATKFINSVHCQYLRTAIAEAYHKAVWTVEHYNIYKKLSSAISHFVTGSVRFIRKNALYLADNYLGLQKDRIVKFLPSKGELEFYLYLPLALPNLQTIPQLEDAVKVTEDLVKTVQDMFPYHLNIKRLYNTYKPTSSLKDMIPPFEGYAMLSGRQHILTFDKRFYEFAPTGCTYLLARDFINGHFTVTVSYAADGQKTITVNIDGKQLSIKPDLSITVDGKPAELPLRLPHTLVTRQHDRVTLHSAHGLSVTCDTQRDFCAVSLSGWHYGRSAGLLGTFDNEPNNDFTRADNTMTADVTQFADSWRVGRCSAAPQTPRRALRSASPECRALFELSSSEMSACFGAVDPKPYMRACLNDQEAEGYSGGAAVTRSVCKAAAAYAHHCRHVEVHVHVPKQCIRCESEGEMRAVKSADVVLIVDENRCMEHATDKLAKIVSNVEKALRLNGMKQNRYGLVGFGGRTAHSSAHIHTVSGKVMTSAAEFARRLASVEFDYSDEQTTDVSAALSIAAGYPYRAGVARTALLVTCSAQCAHARTDDVILRRAGIVLHVLKELRLEPVGEQTTPASAHLYGIDDSSAYTSKDVKGKDLVGDRTLFNQLRSHNDQCASLATGSGGSAFNLDRLLSARVSQQKRFVDVLGRRVAKGDDRSTDCRVCECVSDMMGHARTMCRPCNHGN